jgi:isoamylase
MEGPTDDTEILLLRGRQKRNLLAALLLSQGVPMLLAGDEMGRTQQGNNNAYCQDNEIAWVDWRLAEQNAALVCFVQRLIGIRSRHPVFRRRHFFQGRPIRGGRVKDILWLAPDGREITDEAWGAEHARCLGCYLAGDALDDVNQRGEPIRDDSFLVLVNAHHEPIDFTLPRFRERGAWLVILDTDLAAGLRSGEAFAAGRTYPLHGRSFALLQEQESAA